MAGKDIFYTYSTGRRAAASDDRTQNPSITNLRRCRYNTITSCAHQNNLNICFTFFIPNDDFYLMVLGLCTRIWTLTRK